jgi:uncharacterized lipoprotein NlpE involved in copper resistance
MNKLQKALNVGALVLTLAGCNNEDHSNHLDIYLEGTVKREAGTVAQIVESSGALFGNESVKFSDPTYVLQIETPEGLYTASVKEWNRPLEALALAIKEGSRVRFAKKYNGRDRFGEDRIGKIYSEELTVLDNQ